ncbi:MAG: 16S rRNA (guanine(966)-N(2))-methyltransferase RsmD [Syntrophobacteraceae bacterium]
MRIIAGAFRGRRLIAPKDQKIRPTIDRVREAIFSMIAADVPDARVLDLFAGTGAMGLEALSRGAAFSVFVDQNAVAVRIIRSNIELCGARDRSRVVHEPAASAIQRLASKGELFDLIFMDPPYGKGYIGQALEALDVVAEKGALLIAERHKRDEAPQSLGPWIKDRERRYGDTLIALYSLEHSTMPQEG